MRSKGRVEQLYGVIERGGKNNSMPLAQRFYHRGPGLRGRIDEEDGGSAFEFDVSGTARTFKRFLKRTGQLLLAKRLDHVSGRIRSAGTLNGLRVGVCGDIDYWGSHSLANDLCRHDAILFALKANVHEGLHPA